MTDNTTRLEEIRADRDKWANMAHTRLERAEKAEAEVKRLTFLYGASIDGIRCTCECVSPGDHISPPEYEQDPWCPQHPDVNQIRQWFEALAEKWETTPDAYANHGSCLAAAWRAAAQELRLTVKGEDTTTVGGGN